MKTFSRFIIRLTKVLKTKNIIRDYMAHLKFSEDVMKTINFTKNLVEIMTKLKERDEWPRSPEDVYII